MTLCRVKSGVARFFLSAVDKGDKERWGREPGACIQSIRRSGEANGDDNDKEIFSDLSGKRYPESDQIGSHACSGSETVRIVRVGAYLGTNRDVLFTSRECEKRRDGNENDSGQVQ